MSINISIALNVMWKTFNILDHTIEFQYADNADLYK